MRHFRFVYSFWIIIILSIHTVSGQHQDLQEKPKIWQSETKNNIDTSSLLAAFKTGTVNGHFRFFHSSTFNKGGLKDYDANAIGGGLRFETRNYHGFRVGISGFYIFNIGSSNLAAKDLSSGQPNRYEIGLFDVTNPDNLNEINRLEEFFIHYQKRNTKLTFGRQLLNTPFINLQDGRMRPTAVEGLWIESKLRKNHQIQLGWLYNIAPRSTRKWYDAGESIGLYAVGVDASGVKSGYSGNIQTKGILMANYQVKIKASLTFIFWNMWVENVMNATMVQGDWEKTIKGGKLYSSFQVSSQVKSGEGGNADITKTYYTNDKAVYTYGARVGWKNSIWDYSLNFNRIGESGRYLMPREWGRDYFFTFMPRERNEGLGDVTALLAKASFQFRKNSSVQLSAGTFVLPDVRNFALNKYGMPSYHQVNVDVRHKFKGFLNGLEGQILWVAKYGVGETYDTPRYIIHKVDMHLLNAVLNFRF
ncbi:MAG: outer membrane porin, OprD family [Saprospiraceae bacterium]|nr:outer membrane porin, OprD family [Saprospiraceae bacterium]